MLKNQIKTVIFLGALTGILLAVGWFWQGRMGLTIAIAVAILINFGTYWYSDKIVLKMYKAQPASKTEYPKLYKMVRDLAKKAKMPMPKLYILAQAAPNAFATGRDPKHAAVAVTNGALELLTDAELKGVLAHEMSHILHRDTLIMTVAATVAGVISYIAIIARFSAIFGMGDGDNNILGLLVIAILTPILAMIIQLAISRSREYMADEGGARLVGSGKSLASALEKLDGYSRRIPFRGASKATSHMFITNPFRGGLLSTHPPVKERVKRLRGLRF